MLQVAARVVSKHSLNVMAGHDDVYALLPSGYTILFGSNPQEAADLAAISYKVSALSLIPVTNAMDGFTTSHMMCEALMPEPELLREYLGDPSGRIKCPTVAQEMLFGAKGRVFQLKHYLDRDSRDVRRRRRRRRCGPSSTPMPTRSRTTTTATLVDADARRGSPRNCAASGGASGSTPMRRAPASASRRWSTCTIPASPAGAEPARLPGRLRRPPHPLRARRAALRPRGDGGVLRRSPAATTRRSRPTSATTPRP